MMDREQSPGAPRQDVAFLRERLANLKRCFELGEVITASLDLEDVLERIMTTSRQALAAETCSLLLTQGHDGRGDLVFTVAQGPVADKLPKGRTIKRGHGFAGWVQQHGRPVLVPDAYKDPRFNPEVDKHTGYRTRTLMCVPLAVKGHIIGVAQLINKTNGHPFDEEDLELFALLGAQAAIAIENARLHLAMLEKQRMEFDMEIAATVQRGFLPQNAPELPGFDVAGQSIPCDSTGGDYFDYIPFGQGRTCVAVGDVSGHGIPAALLMASVRAFLRSRSMHPGDTKTVLADVNALMCRDTGRSGNFMTLFLLVVDHAEGVLRYAKAGHDPALVYDPVRGAFEELAAPGIPLGIEAEWEFHERAHLGWKAGQVICIGTDGIWECRDPGDTMYGKARLREVVARASALSASDILAAVLDDVAAFRQVARQQDDITLVVLKALTDSASTKM